MVQSATCAPEDAVEGNQNQIYWPHGQYIDEECALVEDGSGHKSRLVCKCNECYVLLYPDIDTNKIHSPEDKQRYHHIETDRKMHKSIIIH